MMNIGLIEQLSYPPKVPDKPVMVTYFFCQNADYTLKTTVSIVRGLVRRLVDQQEELRSPSRRLWDKATQRPQVRKVSLRELWDIFLAFVEQCNCQQVYVVIDALDECRGDGEVAADQSTLDAAEKALLASHEQLRANLDLESAHISQAVETYVSYKASELDRKHRYGPTLRHKVEAELVSRAEGTFLWVSLVCKRLEEIGASDTTMSGNLE
ncbi:hypothetical protein LTR35_017613 [Friedmanniomyces endolithicus]|uniref:Nephrocystin 3-like N-terminal domain-containing protein n=1 Tax=Friedmanniomyces endolithicus TaxID=329885 RepID=A0AAN6IZ05_9PEZI|nr:hypothetical protein LTR35_017613 [Friedmanniomyces endolithicus]KAK0268780.1 hypothetical protein LTS00_017478 [Friedmanniomyces endolithicus]KAK0302131.1 hypothetical protein LTR82_017980 [Friedmanniomyces endolithicus]KAK0972103.1 hypothetical protein LTR54_017650 [Friedmanniomyces endolithicus]